MSLALRMSGTRGGRDVVEEAAPLVVDDEQRAALPLRRLHERVHDVGHERLAHADVAVRVLVARGARALADAPAKYGSTNETFGSVPVAQRA